jgi:hypothetical protein
VSFGKANVEAYTPCAQEIQELGFNTTYLKRGLSIVAPETHLAVVDATKNSVTIELQFIEAIHFRKVVL